MRRGTPLVLGALLAAASALGVSRAAAAQQAAPGKADYDRWCAGCHGATGEGDGPAAARMLPRPRDFTRALYQIRSTPSGALPTDQDLRRVIDVGMPGTAMPGWEGVLSAAARDDLVTYLKSLSPRFERQPAPETVEITSAPGGGEEAIAEGRSFYEKIECAKCHGEEGRGDGPSAPTLEDNQDFPVRAVDLTENWLFDGGGSVEAIHERLMTGLNGTPMPSFADLLDAEFMTAEQLWNLAHYVRSLSPSEPPRVREVVRAGLVEGAPPAAPDDAAWEGVERYYVPLVGQVIQSPRWFAPMVDGVWVQALHDGRTLSLRLEWNDPSESPDPSWAEWTARVATTMAPDGGSSPAAAPVPGDTAAPGDPTDAAAPAPAGPAPAAGLPDAIAIQFPTTVPEGMERPYFLMGSRDDPVYLWHWESGPAGAREAVARGLEQLDPMTGESPLAARALFDQGRWLLVVQRSLRVSGAEERLQFEAGRPIPIALFAWDGSNGESGTQGAISSWYFLYLDQPTANTVYVVPILAMLLTAALGVVVVTRAQRRANGASRRTVDQPQGGR